MALKFRVYYNDNTTGDYDSLEQAKVWILKTLIDHSIGANCVREVKNGFVDDKSYTIKLSVELKEV